ncbi:MAG: hypothetical protein RDV41_12765, partial [Planctomycetota bacterium]|nr:hypothetical protein [Planctomycetota bacterium]
MMRITSRKVLGLAVGILGIAIVGVVFAQESGEAPTVEATKRLSGNYYETARRQVARLHARWAELIRPHRGYPDFSRFQEGSAFERVIEEEEAYVNAIKEFENIVDETFGSFFEPAERLLRDLSDRDARCIYAWPGCRRMDTEDHKWAVEKLRTAMAEFRGHEGAMWRLVHSYVRLLAEYDLILYNWRQSKRDEMPEELRKELRTKAKEMKEILE